MYAICLIISATGYAQVTEVAHWNFDEGSGTNISDGQGSNTGTLFNPGANAWISGYSGGAIDFTQKADPDTSCLVSVPHDASISFNDTESFTIVTVAKVNDPTAAAGETSLWGKGVPSSNPDGWYHLSFKNNALRFMVWDGSNLASPAGDLNGEIVADEWAQIVCVRDVASDSLLVYVNGVLLDKSEDITTGDISTVGDLHTGISPESN